jgi:hypothetical protein
MKVSPSIQTVRHVRSSDNTESHWKLLLIDYSERLRLQGTLEAKGEYDIRVVHKLLVQ